MAWFILKIEFKKGNGCKSLQLFRDPLNTLFDAWRVALPGPHCAALCSAQIFQDGSISVAWVKDDTKR